MRTSWGAIWLGLALITVLTELAMGTDVAFALMVLAAFALFPFTLGVFRRFDSIAQILVGVMFAKLLFVSQWFKIGLGQPADSFLDQPLVTMSALLLGMVGLTAAGALAAALTTQVPVRVITARHEPDFMLWLGIGAMALGATSEFARLFLFMDTLTEIADDETTTGGGALLSYMSNLPMFAVAVLTARRLLISENRKNLDAAILASVLLCVGAGLLGNSRTTMLSGAVAFLLTFLSYGGRIRVWHAAAGIIGVLTINSIVFPLIDLQRQLPKDLPTSEYLEQTLDLAAGLVSGTTADSQLEERLMRIYQSWDTRQYYGSPFGLLDRFSPSQVDEVAAFVVENGPAGLGIAMRPFTRLVPPTILKMFNLSHPEMGSVLIQFDISRASTYSSPNYGIIAETLYYVGLFGLPLLIVLFMTPFLFGLHALYGGFSGNYLGTFAAALFFMTLADGQMAELYARLIEQGLLYALLYALARFTWTLFIPAGRRQALPAVNRPHAD